ncbi:MAG: ADP-heptose--LPS heptosyltransferase RfaF, partial [Schleiferiaceae bacterium]|nr:ADP-heptose--LPS heptosyltransferase RfaF [Schleiferiaceae bacterium]
MHVLVIRLSAMGDVAMTVPVILAALDQNPELRITVLSRKSFHHFFPDSDRLHFEAVDTKGEHKGLRGLRRLYKQLRKKYEFNAVADFHNVLRSQVITGLFNLKRIPSAAIKKGRA